MTWLVVIFNAFFFLPGTFIHELSHYIVAAVFGKVDEFSVFPSWQNGRFVFGSVKFRVRFKVVSCFVSGAPLIWWFMGCFLLFRWGLVETGHGLVGLHRGAWFIDGESLSLSDLVGGWFLLQLAWAGLLSSRDLRNIAEGLLSLSGAMICAVVVGGYVVFRTWLS